MKWHNDGVQPAKDQIFVFGSNLAGMHGAGAAKQAQKFYGARSGQGVGLRGRSYAIPTKDFDIETLPLETISQYVMRFVKFTQENQNAEFFISRVGCGYAGYTDKDMAPLFRGCGNNCDFANDWKAYLDF